MTPVLGTGPRLGVLRWSEAPGLAGHWKSLHVIMHYCKESHQAVSGIGCRVVVARARAPTRGCPYGGWLDWGRKAGSGKRGAYEGCPYRWMGGLGRKAGAGVGGAYEGTHKGCPYGGSGAGDGGEARSPRVDKVILRSHSMRREVLGEGALRGRSPRTREGRIGPTAQKGRGQGLGIRG